MADIKAADYLTKEQCISILNELNCRYEEDREKLPGFLCVRVFYANEDGGEECTNLSNRDYKTQEVLPEVVAWQRAAEEVIEWHNFDNN